MTINVTSLFGIDTPEGAVAVTSHTSLVAALPTDDEVANLGKANGSAYAEIADRLLAEHKTSDLGALSGKITELVSVSKGFDPRQTRHGLFDKLVGAIRGEREHLLAHMQSVKQQVDGIVKQMDAMADLQRQRIHDLGELQRANFAYHEGLKAAAAKGEEWLVAVQAALAAPVESDDGFAAPRISALHQSEQRLQVAINDFRNGMTLAKQQAIEIQMTTNNARSILEEFERAKLTVIPALKSLLSQQLIAIEQKHAAETDDMLRSTLDSALKAGAQLTSDNTIAIATLQQKAAVNVQTLDDCQKILEATAVKLAQIEDAGRQQRIADAAARGELEQRMLASIKQ